MGGIRWLFYAFCIRQIAFPQTNAKPASDTPLWKTQQIDFDYGQNGTVYTWEKPPKPHLQIHDYTLNVMFRKGPPKIALYIFEAIERRVQYGPKILGGYMLGGRIIQTVLPPMLCKSWVNAESCIIPEDFYTYVDETCMDNPYNKPTTNIDNVKFTSRTPSVSRYKAEYAFYSTCQRSFGCSWQKINVTLFYHYDDRDQWFVEILKIKHVVWDGSNKTPIFNNHNYYVALETAPPVRVGNVTARCLDAKPPVCTAIVDDHVISFDPTNAWTCYLHICIHGIGTKMEADVNSNVQGYNMIETMYANDIRLQKELMEIQEHQNNLAELLSAVDKTLIYKDPTYLGLRLQRPDMFTHSLSQEYFQITHDPTIRSPEGIYTTDATLVPLNIFGEAANIPKFETLDNAITNDHPMETFEALRVAANIDAQIVAMRPPSGGGFPLLHDIMHVLESIFSMHTLVWLLSPFIIILLIFLIFDYIRSRRNYTSVRTLPH